jgi:hypothetical protein
VRLQAVEYFSANVQIERILSGLVQEVRGLDELRAQRIMFQCRSETIKSSVNIATRQCY